MNRLDVWIRFRVQSLLHWTGKRFGWTRTGVCRQLAWAVPSFYLLSLVGDELSWLMIFLGVMAFFVNALMGAAIFLVGVKTLEKNGDDVGGYMNWERWRFLRHLELVFLVFVFLITYEGVAEGDFLELFYPLRSISLLGLLYATTCSEFPPRERKKQARVAYSGAS